MNQQKAGSQKKDKMSRVVTLIQNQVNQKKAASCKKYKYLLTLTENQMDQQKSQKIAALKQK